MGKPFAEPIRPLVIGSGVTEEDLHRNDIIAECRDRAQARGPRTAGVNDVEACDALVVAVSPIEG